VEARLYRPTLRANLFVSVQPVIVQSFAVHSVGVPSCNFSGPDIFSLIRHYMRLLWSSRLLQLGFMVPLYEVGPGQPWPA